MEPTGSDPVSDIGWTSILSSSRVYPNAACLSTIDERSAGGPIVSSGRSSSRTMFPLAHSPYGCLVATSDLISSSSMIRPCSVSKRNIRPGRRRPLYCTFSGDTSSTPVSDAMISRLSLVTV